MARMPKWPKLILHAIPVFLLVSSLSQQSAGEDGILVKIEAAGKWLQMERDKFDVFDAADVDKSLIDSLNSQTWGPLIFREVLEDLENRINNIPVEKRDKEREKLSLFEVNDGVIVEILASAKAYLNEYGKTGVPKGREEENVEYKLLIKLTDILKKLFLNREQMEFLENGGKNNAESSNVSEKTPNHSNVKRNLLALHVQVNKKIVELIKQIWFRKHADIVKKLSDQNNQDKMAIRKNFHDFIKQLDLMPYFEIITNIVGQMKAEFVKLVTSIDGEKTHYTEEEQKSAIDLQNLMADLDRIFKGEYSRTFHRHLDKFEHILDFDHPYKSYFEQTLNQFVHFARNLLEKLEEALEKHVEENIRKYERYHANVLQNSTSQQMLGLFALAYGHLNNKNNKNNKLEQYHNYSLLVELASNLMGPRFFKYSKPSWIKNSEFVKNRKNWSTFDWEENALIQSLKDCLVRKDTDMNKHFDSVFGETRNSHWLPERLMLHTAECKASENGNLRFRVALNALRTLALYGRLLDFYEEIDEEKLADAFREENASQIHEEYEKMRAMAIEEMGGYGAKFSEYIFGELSKQSEGKMKKADKAGLKRKEFDGKDKHKEAGETSQMDEEKVLKKQKLDI